MTTIEAVEQVQAYCRGCATPTFMFDPHAAYQAHQMYCDNCFGTRIKYGYDEGSECGECDYCQDGYPEDCENRDTDGIGPRGNTDQYDPVLDRHDFHRLMHHRHPGVVYMDLPLVATPPPVVEDTPEPTRSGILDHTCRCGSTEFYLRARDTCTVSWRGVDIAEIAHSEDGEADADYEVDAYTYVDDYHRDENESDHVFVCCGCERDYTGEWC